MCFGVLKGHGAPQMDSVPSRQWALEQHPVMRQNVVAVVRCVNIYPDPGSVKTTDRTTPISFSSRCCASYGMLLDLGKSQSVTAQECPCQKMLTWSPLCLGAAEGGGSLFLQAISLRVCDLVNGILAGLS